VRRRISVGREAEEHGGSLDEVAVGGAVSVTGCID
jgi:hypothetical protein